MLTGFRGIHYMWLTKPCRISLYLIKMSISGCVCCTGSMHMCVIVVCSLVSLCAWWMCVYTHAGTQAERTGGLASRERGHCSPLGEHTHPPAPSRDLIRSLLSWQPHTANNTLLGPHLSDCLWRAREWGSERGTLDWGREKQRLESEENRNVGKWEKKKVALCLLIPASPTTLTINDTAWYYY